MANFIDHRIRGVLDRLDRRASVISQNLRGVIVDRARLLESVVIIGDLIIFQKRLLENFETRLLETGEPRALE